MRHVHSVKRTILKTLHLASLLSAAQFQYMKGYNHSMNQLLSLLSSSDSLWAIILPLACLVAVLVTLPKCLMTFVQSWIHARRSSKTLTLFQTTLEESLRMILMSLKAPSETEQPKDESMNISSQPLPRDKLLELADKLKEVIDNEEY